MPKTPFQKLKLLYIKDYLNKYSDETHFVTVKMIIDMLGNNGISAERKSIYSDLELLRDLYGLDIISPKRGYFYLGEREFELAETKMLVDMVSSSRFLTEKKSAKLISKLEQFTSVYNAQSFSSQTFLRTRVKNENEAIYRTVDEIFTAIYLDKQITFKYFRYNANKRKIYSKSGGEYTVSPFAMLTDEDNYYLAAYDENADIIRHFRTDRMENVHIAQAQRHGKEKFDAQNYLGNGVMMFSMYSGKIEPVTLRFKNELSHVVIDRFGKKAVLSPFDDEHFDVQTNIMISPQFFGWLCGLSGGAKIISPTSVADEYSEYLKNELNLYQ